jgi:hypothetical protein
MDPVTGEPERHSCSSAEITGYGQFATVQLNQRSGDRQPQSCSFVFFGQVICDLFEGP